MNFKKFNGTIWETVQHKVYGSGTEQLASFPSQIHAAGEPLTDYLISGNTIQDGTPTTEAPVNVVGCGDWDATAQQYKLPITCGGETKNIYLGTLQSTRRIKKLVLTGEETWTYESAYTRFYTVFQNSLVIGIRATPAFCTHFQVISDSRPLENVPNYSMYSNSINMQWFFKNTEYSTVDAWKSYLAAQYAAGTPVTVWYVLAEPETAVVNEPIHKIGDYADTITMAQAGVTIPTFDGDNTISFGTTVQPSAMSAAFKGWHPVQGAKQYDGSEWR